MTYTMQTFLDTSRRRILEAKALLTVPKRFYDGAATCALLAAECALKATLLYGRQVTRLDEIPEVIRRKAFNSKAGHNLSALWGFQDASIQARSTGDQQQALDALHRIDRYHHRYGVKRPDHGHAEAVVQAAETVVDWMKGVVL